MTEETITELASILAAAYERYRRIVRVAEDAENLPEKNLIPGPSRALMDSRLTQ